jgi:CRP/FNR family cyclic AMP-dependent transcriptional regulator
MKTATWKAGDIIFKRGDYADCIYMLVSGRVRLEEIDHVLESGDLFGEIGVFSPAHERTQSAPAISDVELLWLTESELAEVCYKNPVLAFHFLRLSISRLLANAGRPMPTIAGHREWLRPGAVLFRKPQNLNRESVPQDTVLRDSCP